MFYGRIKDIFKINNKIPRSEYITITKKKKMIVIYNEDIKDRECYYLTLRDNSNNLRFMYYLLKTVLEDKNVIIDIHNVNVFTRSSIGYEYIKTNDLYNISLMVA